MCHIIFIVCVPDWILYYILCGNFYWMCYIANKILRKGNYEFLSDVMAMVPYHRWNITNWAHAHNECRNAWTPRNTGRSDLAQNVRWTSRYCLPRFAYNESIRKTPAHDAYIFSRIHMHETACKIRKTLTWWHFFRYLPLSFVQMKHTTYAAAVIFLIVEIHCIENVLAKKLLSSTIRSSSTEAPIASPLISQPNSSFETNIE